MRSQPLLKNNLEDLQSRGVARAHALVDAIYSLLPVIEGHFIEKKMFILLLCGH